MNGTISMTIAHAAFTPTRQVATTHDVDHGPHPKDEEEDDDGADDDSHGGDPIVSSRSRGVARRRPRRSADETTPAICCELRLGDDERRRDLERDAAQQRG